MRGRTVLLGSGTRPQILRFLIVGGTNTVLTYGLFIGLGLLIPAWIAYTIAFALGLVWTVFGSSRFVFRSGSSPRRILLFTVWYLALYGIGQLVIRLVNPAGIFDLLLISIIVLVITTPLTFVGGRFIFVPRSVDRAPVNKEEPPK